MQMQNHIWDRRLLWGIRVWELAAVLLLYLLFGFFYYGALYITSQPWGGFTAWEQVVLNYCLQFVLTVPIWLIIFRKLQHWSLQYRLLVHILTLPVYAFTFRMVFYEACELFNLGHLGDAGSFWDVYIPGLFYCLQFGIFHSYEYYQRFKQEELLQSELRELALQNELTALKAQINPHFLYNVFNTISASLPPSQEKTRVMIAQLSDMFRYQLQASQRDQVHIEEEVAFARKYLELEKERFGDRLQYEFIIDPDVGRQVMPPMLLQPLVENAVKHGLAPLIEGGKISVSITQNDRGIHFAIGDTGRGLNGQAPESFYHKGIGLTNTRQRLQKMYGAELQVSHRSPQGLIVSFTIPRS